ncbi:uncharacterized protein LOC124171707 isoform X3 [Ischnura elegans]|uniref:uncharacterized protein LOC124171707 isoform X3 n=1 Tax=Ischnura elegans TaxID=197161 RepID=UPI001ED8BDCC|nr:uncharacterized protein LOC124171707 isoform X3 [Ischnura elegans]
MTEARETALQSSSEKRKSEGEGVHRVVVLATADSSPLVLSSDVYEDIVHRQQRASLGLAVIRKAIMLRKCPYNERSHHYLRKKFRL